jgi:hypothetical protein
LNVEGTTDSPNEKRYDDLAEDVLTLTWFYVREATQRCDTPPSGVAINADDEYPYKGVGA